MNKRVLLSLLLSIPIFATASDYQITKQLADKGV